MVAVGHRVVHGGARFAEPALVDDALIEEVSKLVPLAPLHNPANLEGMRVARKLFPDVPQVAVFDTAFHQTMPPVAYTYAVPAGVARGAPDPPLWLPRDLVRLRQPGGRAPARQTCRRDQPDRPPPGQRRLRRGHPRRPVGRHLDGVHAARGAGHGNPLRRPRPCRPRTPAPRARLVDRRRRQTPSTASRA